MARTAVKMESISDALMNEWTRKCSGSKGSRKWEQQVANYNSSEDAALEE